MHRDKAYAYGKQMAERLRELIPRQLFDVAIQAAIGAQDHRAGDREGQAQGRLGEVLRRRHHAASASCWRQQKKGKARMRRVGRVDVPQEAFIAALRVDDGSKRDTKK